MRSTGRFDMSLDGLSEALARSDIKANRQRLFLRLAVAVRGGMTPADFLSALAAEEAASGRLSYARVYRRVEAKIRSGEYAIHEALHEFTTSDDRCFLYAEEKVANLALLFQLAYDTAKKRALIVSAIRTPFLFPIYLFVMLLGFMVLGGTILLPNFSALIPVSEWEFPSQVVYYSGKVFLQWWPFFVALLVGSIGWVLWSLPNLHSNFRKQYLDKVFPWSLYKSFQSSTFVLNLAAMFTAKVPIMDSVRGYAMVSNPYASSFARRMISRLESEQTSTDMRALDIGYIDSNTMTSMRILNNKLPISEVIQTIGDAEFELLADDVTRTAQTISKVLTLVLAAFLLFTLYGSFSEIPLLTEKLSAMSSAKK